MSGVWSDVVTAGLSTAGDLFVDFLPVIGLGLGLTVFGIVWAVFVRKG